MFEKLISFWAGFTPDAVAIATPAGSASFAVLDADVNRMARRLAPVAQPGARVAVQVAGAGLHWVVLLALARLGCVSASLPLIGEREDSELLAILRPDLLLSEGAAEAAGVPGFRLTPEWVAETFAASAEPVTPHEFAPEDAVRIVLSSGTTGAPKKMLLTRQMIDTRIVYGGLGQAGHRRVHAAVGVDSEPGFRLPLIAWASGYAAVYPEAGYKWADFLLGSRPEVLVMVPAQLDAVLASLPSDFPPQSALNLILISAAPSAALFAKARARLTPNIYVTYGSSETGLVAAASPALLNDNQGLTGLVSGFAAVEVVDEADRPLPWGTPGRVRMRSVEMVQGYLDDPELTARHFRDGWFYPGDLGAISATGRLSVHGRETEVLELGGLRIAPDAIEATLLACAGVQDAAAFSVALGTTGVHQPRAVVVCAPDFDLEAARVALGRAFPQLQVGVSVRDHIPRSHRGKIDREALRRTAGGLSYV